MPNKIYDLANIFYKRAQVLEIGQSSLSLNDIQNWANKWKSWLSGMKDSIPARAGWNGKEGTLFLAALDKILANEELSSHDIDSALMDINSNLEMDLNEAKKYLNAYSTVRL